jgi:hypothetical protein
VVLEARAEARYQAELAEYEAKQQERTEKAERTSRKPGGRAPQPPTPGVGDKEQYNFTDPDSPIMKKSNNDGLYALRGAVLAGLAVMIIRPLAHSVHEIISPPFNGPAAMAAYLDDHVSHEALIETWEQEMGFLTDHNYHFPSTL